MRYFTLGRTGLQLSALGLGTLTWGRDTDLDQCSKILETFIEGGGTLIDTSASYGRGRAEEALGHLWGNVVEREEMIVISKAGLNPNFAEGPHPGSRANLLGCLDASLRRLNTDYLDLWLVEAPDKNTPFEETLGALVQAQRSGKVRYVGLSNFPAWQCAQGATLLQTGSDLTIFPGLAAVEVEYSLLRRHIELDLLPASHALGFGLIGWSALGRGVLTGKYRNSTPPDSRGASGHFGAFIAPYLREHPRTVVEALATAAQGMSASPLQVALAWLSASPVDFHLVGPRTFEQMSQIMQAVANPLDLPAQVVQALNEVSGLQLPDENTYLPAR